jgi:flavin-binding protein dodecin
MRPDPGEVVRVAEPFVQKPAGGAIARLLGSGRAVAEIEALLAGAARLCEVSPESVEQIAKRNGIDLERRLAGPRRNLYRRFLEHCLVDCALTPEENVDLAHLQRLLRLDDADAARIHDEVAQAVYGRAVAEVLRDQQLDPEERSFLERIGADLALSPQVTAQIYEKGAEQSREGYLARAHTHQNALFASPTAKFDLPGSSEQSLEDAIRAALAEAARALPGLASARLREIRTDVREGRVVRWHVVLETEFERKP